MEFASKFVDRAIDFVLEVSIRQLKYIICYKGNVKELNDSIAALELERDKVDHQVECAKNNVKEIEANVKAWLTEVKGKINENKEFKKDKERAEMGCWTGVLPFLWYRHKLGRRAMKLAESVKLLKGKSQFDTVSYQQNPSSTDATLSNVGYVEFESRNNTVKKIMEKLEDSTVRMIGVHGPGGVGKSTFVKEIAKKARDNKLFNVVVMVNITRDPNLQKIQEEIAYNLGLTFEGEGENGRADRLRRRLKQEKENTLVILDDLWDGLDLKKLGIPFDDDDSSRMTVKDQKDFGYKMVERGKSTGDYDGNKLSPTSGSKSGTPFDDDDYSGQVSVKGEKDFSYKMLKNENSPGEYKGCKILLTSRIKEVLSEKMNVMESSIFPVKELDDEEAVTLFKKVAEIPDGNSKFKPEIVKSYCAGLPMAILTVGRALRHKSESVWEDALEKLKKQELMGVQKSMEISVKMSYDHLESEELKSIFLFCAQMGHEQSIMDLVKYCFGLGILKGVHTLRDARVRICTSIQKLKGSSLMSDGNSSDQFNMHDMVRDAALSIAHKDQNVFTLRNDKLDDWPDEDELEKCSAISIYKSEIVDDLPEVINCPHLRVFHIDSDDPSLNIPDRFFEGMRKLRVLILTGIHLPSLPSSIKCLSNLRMLCLERCILDNLSGVGDLKKLRILSLSGSKIENLADELGGLVKLQLLDISDCSIVDVLKKKIISSLTSLEELYIRKSLIKMEVEGETNQSQISVLSELKHLHQLKIIDMWIPSAEVLPSNLFFDKLNDYKIVIGDFKMLSIVDFKMPNKYEASRSLVLQLKVGIDIHSLKGIKMLFKRVENLLLGELNGVRNAFYELNLDGFPYLKHLSIINNLGIEYIVYSMELSHPLDVFLNLESLNLYKLENLKEICCSPVTDTSFSKLKTIKVKMCTQLKNLFSFYIVKFLASLETVDVSECDLLEKIVVEEREVDTDKVKFHKLCSLTLQDLPSFTSFYTNMLSVPILMGRQGRNTGITEITTAEDEHRVTASLSLFGEQVEIPNLESLKLSSIKVHKIWSDQPLSSFCFENLIKLTVKDCHNLRYLCSLSVASSLKKLKGLFISECQMMENIFITEGNNVNYSVEQSIFPKLEEIQLTKMKMLKDIWPAKVSADSFTSLISVHIEGCEELDKIFPSHMKGWFKSLDSLKVVDCRSVEVIFEITNPPNVSAPRDDTKLQLILLNNLQNLKQVWDRDPGETVDFTNLRSIKVSVCPKLSYVLPASIAKGIDKLEDFSVLFCNGMEEIVSFNKESETNNKPLGFPEVTYLEFHCLRNLRCFYMGGHTIECPKLKRLAVNTCPKLETFTTEGTNEEGKPVFSADKVISNLEYMDIGSQEAKWLQRNIGKYRMHRLKQLHLRSLPSIDILYWFLHRIPNLERLNLSFTYDIKELVPSGNIAPQERLGTVLQLKELTLLGSHIEDIGFERDPVLQRVERLALLQCYSLIKLAHSSVSLTHLTYLELNGCGKLTNLMASSTAESLVQLTTMKVIDCYEVKEIVTNEGNEDDIEVNIVFGKLITIELVTLTNLSSFCSYKSCMFLFPSLEKLIVRDCPKLRTFTEGHTNAQKLQNILAVEGEEEEKWYWEGDLNATIKKVFADKVSYEYTYHLVISRYPELEQVWNGKDSVQESSFRNLKTLVMENCDYLVHVIPSHLLPCFKNLEELRVRRCSAVQVIFNINDNRATKALGMFRLKTLSVFKLPKLAHVWDKDPEGILGLQVLQDISVDKCNSLKYLFPPSVAKDLANILKKLTVENCEELVEIFAEDETASEEASRLFVFRCLSSLTLRKLPGLKYFYPGLHTLEWPVLKKIDISECKWEILKCQEAYPEEQVLIPVKKVNLLIPSLELLSFGIGDGTVIWDLRSQKLEFQYLQDLQEELDSVLYGSLQMVPNIEKLEVKYGSSEKIFSVERPKPDYTGFLSHLKGLRLYNLNDLKSIGLEHSWLHPIPENLQTLDVEWCYDLKNLAPYTVSFSNLTSLAVTYCSNLQYLFTSSTAKSLGLLKRMEIRNCKSMQEVVSKEGEESHQDEQIKFEQLQALYLEDLPKLKCFYSGNFTVCFPSLEKVSLIDCLGMKTFCPSIEITSNSTKLLLGVGLIKDATRWEGDLNTSVRKMNEKKMTEFVRDLKHLRLEDNPHFQDIWHGSVPVPDAYSFSNLESLVVDGCEFLSDVLPFHLLPFLIKMERLEVRNSSSVKTIFDLKCITEDQKMTMGPAPPIPFSLKKLVLMKLSNLESVWNEDLVKLETLRVEHCEGLMEIVAGIVEDPKGTNLVFTFPCLTSLTLLDVPKLKCFFCSLHCVEFNMFHCQDPYIEKVCIEKVTPNLDHLSLGEKELRMIWHGQCQGNLLHKVKVLDLLGFDIEPDVFPYGFLQKVPNIEELVVSNSSFKEIFCSERPNVDYIGSLSQLKGIKLVSLSELISIGLEHSWVEESFLKNLETLEATECSRLKNLLPPSVCFPNLMHLTVTDCHDMIHLFTSSTARSLAQLKQMDISDCKSIQEIVSNEGDESHHDEIIFGQLQTLNLEHLPNLKRFYNGNITLSFPSLEQLSVLYCGRMETFGPGTINAGKLSAVKFKRYEDAIPLEVDLNFTIRKVYETKVAKFAQKVKQLKLGDNPEVHDIWHGSFPVPSKCFINLKSLIVERCEFLLSVIPSHLLGLLCNLEELEVRQCHSVKAIFEAKDIAKDTKKLTPTLRLKKMTFEQLPNLENVWDSDPHEVISLQTLKEVSVNGCDSLESVFPASVAQSLVTLEKLDVQQCERLVEIVAKDEATTKGEPKEFVLACLTSITLRFLPVLKCFYPGMHKLECPNLKQIHVFHCDKLKTLTCESQSFPEAQPEYQVGISLYPHALFLAEKVIPNLEFLALNKEETMMIWHRQFHANLLQNLQALQLQCFHSVSDTFPYGLIQEARSIEKLVVNCSSFKEIFCSEGPSTDFTEEILSHLKCLQLIALSKLNSIGLEHSWMEPISENLEKLQIVQCHCLRNLVPPTVSFSSLVDLSVSQCRGLVYLITPSTARSLRQLKNMSIEKCESLQEIVFEEADESSNHGEDDIIFEQLNTLSLHSLPRLGRFCKGSISFPSLEQLSIINCCGMEIFCLGTVSAKKLSAVKFKEAKEAIPLGVDLNSTIRKEFEATVARFAKNVKQLTLGDNPEVHDIWHGSFPVPFKCFINLKSLIVERCEFLSSVIPSHLLGLLCNLEELEVRQCHSVKVIFEVKDIAKDTKKLNTGPATLRLKKMSFEQLPNLEHVWDSDPHEVISLQTVQEVSVNECDSLESVFPASVAQSLVKLEELDIQQCGRLVEIVAKDEADTEGVPKEFYWACVSSITLRILPVLKCFYPGLHKLECPNLKGLYVFHCDKLKTFTCESQSFPEAQPVYQRGVWSYPHALFLAEKVIPILEGLTLSKEEIMMIWNGQFHPNLLHNLKALQLQCFHSVSDTFPYELLLEAPNIEDLSVNCSSFNEIFCSERPSANFNKEVFSHLKCLQLSSLSELISIGLEHSWMDTISENLEEIEIVQCHCLRNLAPPTVSFSSLVDLNVSQCRGLVYLFTSSTARSLHQLKNMSVEDCESLQEIVFEEVKESPNHDEDEIIFDHLKNLSLHSLPRLGRFCKGSLSFPSLEKLSVIDCRGMETFCLGTITANKLSAVKFEEAKQKLIPLEVDLNSTIRKVFEATAESNSNDAVRTREEEQIDGINS